MLWKYLETFLGLQCSYTEESIFSSSLSSSFTSAKPKKKKKDECMFPPMKGKRLAFLLVPVTLLLLLHPLGLLMIDRVSPAASLTLGLILGVREIFVTRYPLVVSANWSTKQTARLNK